MRVRVGLLLVVLLLGGACSRPAEEPVSAPAPAPETTPVTVAPAPPALPVGADIRGGGAPGLHTVVEAVAVAPAEGGARVEITFRDGLPVWAAHRAARGQLLQIDLGAPLAAGLVPAGKADPFGVSLGGGPSGSLVSISGIPAQLDYEVRENGRTLTVTVRQSGRAPDGGRPPVFPGMEKAGDVVDAFLKARVGAPGPGAGALSAPAANSLSALAKPQFEHLYGTQPLAVSGYRMWRQSGQWPGDVLFYLVRLEGDGWFADEVLYVTAPTGEPIIAMVLGHPPVDLPADADGMEALRTADLFLGAWSRRDRQAMWDALAPSAQKKLGDVSHLSGGLSNPHPFRYEVHGMTAAGPGCWRLDVLRSEEYTGEGELGWGVSPLYVTREEGRFGALLEGGCGQ